MSKNIVFEGWLTKSPPTKRIWRTKWRRRWFALRQSGELPGQYFLDYYADRNCRRLKGTINLDLCEQVDAGLHMERSNNVTLDPKLRGSVFTIQTQSRTYHLEADCEADMVKWVDAICSVCGLQPKDNASNDSDPYINAYEMNTISDYRSADTTGPYIPISECITGVRAQNSQRAFTFDSKDIVIRSRRSQENVPSKSNKMYLSQPHIRFNNAEFSENDSNLSDEDCKSLNASQCNIREWAAAKSFTKTNPRSKYREYHHGPPVPPRPPKTLAMSRGIFQRDHRVPERQNQPEIGHQHQVEVICHQPRRRVVESTNAAVQVPEPVEDPAPAPAPAAAPAPAPASAPAPTPAPAPAPALAPVPVHAAVPAPVPAPEPVKIVAPPSPGPIQIVPNIKITDFDEEERYNNAMQYSNIVLAMPPAVDRALKPRHSSHSIGNVNNLGIQPMAAAIECGVHGNEERRNTTVGASYVNANYFVQQSSPAQSTSPDSDCRVHGKRKIEEEQREPIYMNLFGFIPRPPQVQRVMQFNPDRARSDVLQYLDLDLHTSTPPSGRKTFAGVHGKSWSAADAASAYKTVDFLKTEAFNITRQDAEASRNSQY